MSILSTATKAVVGAAMVSALSHAGAHAQDKPKIGVDLTTLTSPFWTAYARYLDQEAAAQDAFPAALARQIMTQLDAIEAAISRTEKTHGGGIPFAIRTALPRPDIWNDIGPRHHARAVFAHLGVWNTEHNNGVLIYLLLADRDVEIIADRGLSNRVTAAEWEGVCRLMEGHFRAGRYLEGSVAGVEAVGSLLARHFPAQGAHPRNELPDRPVLL